MKPICFIGARGGSKGVPRKNIRMLGTKPLIAHTIETALDSNAFGQVIVSTEDKEIATIAKKYGAEIPFFRPKELATDKAGMGEVLVHGIKKLYSLGYDFDIFVNRDCTVPFIQRSDIVGSINMLKSRNCNAVLAVYIQHFNPYFNMMELDSNGFLRFSKTLKERPKSRQEAPLVYQLTGLFAYDARKFLKYNTPFPPKSLPYEVPPETGLMIDTELEFQIAEMIIEKKLFSQ